MGIYHFAGLGRSPGAVTAGLSYIHQKYGYRHPNYGEIVEGLVLFTSAEVATGDLKAFPGTTHNEYGKRTTKKTWTAKHNDHVVELIRGFLNHEFPNISVYLVQVDINNFDDCLEQAALAMLKFHPPVGVGKHIWINITGGSNLVNAALTQVAYLSGVVARLYYTFVGNVHEDGKYLQPFSNKQAEFCYGEIVPIKLRFGSRHLKVLEMLKILTASYPETEKYVSSNELLGRLQNETPDFSGMDKGNFLRNFLNVMPGIEQKGNRQTGQEDLVRLSEEGQRILELTARPLFRSLVLREQPEDETLEELLDGLNINKLS